MARKAAAAEASEPARIRRILHLEQDPEAGKEENRKPRQGRIF